MVLANRAIVVVITLFSFCTATRMMASTFESSIGAAANIKSTQEDPIPPTMSDDLRSEGLLSYNFPIGGPGGKPWDDLVNINSTDPGHLVKFTPHRRIAEIHASCGDRPDSLQFIYRDNYNKVGVASEIVKTGAIHGTEAKKKSQKKIFKIDLDDRIKAVWLETCLVLHGSTKRTRVCYIEIQTTKKLGDEAFKCGDSTWRDATGKELPATWGKSGTALFAFAGRSGEGIDQLSSYWGNDDAY